MSKTIEHIASFFVNVTTITLTAAAAFRFMKINGNAIRNYADFKKK